MFIIKYRKIWYAFSALIVAASLFSVFYFGLKLGIDFTGGSLLEIEYKDSGPRMPELQEAANKLNFGNIILQPTGGKGLIARSRTLSEAEHQQLLSALGNPNEMTEIRFDSIGPVIGKEMKSKSLTALILVIAMIIFYIAFVFRKVSAGLPRTGRGVSSFKYGLMAIVALVHDVTLPVGVFAALGRYLGVEIDILFVTAILTVLGFSVHDTIVVFDRIRENLRKGIGQNFEETVGLSLRQTIVRSINTSLTVLLVLTAILVFGGETTRYFSLALIIGVSIGTYSSIFLASPLLVTIHKFQQRKK